jgi:uncharacterized protein
MTPWKFFDAAMSNSANAALLSRLPALGLNECHLTAGCLFQPVWNRATGWAPDHGIRDYDVFYFDACDTSWDAEDAVIRRVDAITNDLGIKVQTRNQARVHLWYEQRFGAHCPELASARDGIDRFLISCTCVGIDVASHELYAPDGLDDLEGGVLRMNPATPQPDLFRRKAADYQARWQWLTIVA